MINWAHIKTVFLDMDGTLLDLHFDHYFWLTHLPKRLSDIHQLSAEQAQSRIQAVMQTELGTLNWYCLDYWSKKLALDIRSLKEEVQDRIAFRPHVHDFLAHLRNHNLRVVIVTNAHPDSLSLKIAITRLDQLVDRVISAHELGYAKEDPRFWDRLMQCEPFEKTHTLLIDDTPSVLESARHYGIAQLLMVLAPDSQKHPLEAQGFPGVQHFDELLSRPPQC